MCKHPGPLKKSNELNPAFIYLMYCGQVSVTSNKCNSKSHKPQIRFHLQNCIKIIPTSIWYTAERQRILRDEEQQHAGSR